MQKMIARFKTSWYHWEPCRTGKATDISLLRQFEPIRLDRQIGNFRFMFKIFGRLDIWQEFTGQSFLKSIKSLISLSKIIWQWKVLEHLGDNPPVKACQQKVLFMKDPQLRKKIRRFQKIKMFPTLTAVIAFGRSNPCVLKGGKYTFRYKHKINTERGKNVFKH